MTRDEVDRFEKLVAQLTSTYEEISSLSKRKPGDAVNKFKLALINTLVGAANEVLGDAYRPFADFSLFDDDDLPQNSDVVFVLGQYLGCCEALRSENVTTVFKNWYWLVEPDDGEEPGENGLVRYTQAAIPRKLVKRR